MGENMPRFFVLFATMIFSGAVSADSFTVIRDGKEYLCQESTPSQPGGSLECVNDAYAGPFSRQEAFDLCEGARSVAPSACAKRAYSGPFSKNDSIQLCRRATSTGPVECATRAYNGPFSQIESIQLCRQSGTAANADCAIRAYAGPYSKEEAIRLCRTNPNLVLRALAATRIQREKVREFKSNEMQDELENLSLQTKGID